MSENKFLEERKERKLEQKKKVNNQTTIMFLCQFIQLNLNNALYLHFPAVTLKS